MNLKISFCVIALFILPCVFAQSWSLTGNDITGTQFIGTIGAGDELVFKSTTPGGSSTEYLRLTNKGLFYISNQGVGNHFFGYQVGLSNTNGTNNSSFGYQSLKSNSSGSNNTSFGYLAMLNSTTSSNNTAVGSNALKTNTTGGNNIAFGYQSLNSNSTSSFNCAIGSSALYSNSSGASNIAVGYQALYSNISSDYNLAIGNSSLYANTSGMQNIGIGQSSLFDNTIGNNNIAVGKFALANNINGSDNIAIGISAQFWNSSGSNNISVGNSTLLNSTTDNQIAIGSSAGENLTTGIGNTIIGYFALNASSTSSYNTAVGFESLKTNNANGANTAIGYRSLLNNSSGSSNTAVGYRTFENQTIGANNTGVGHEAGFSVTTGAGNTIIGANAGAAISTGSGNTFIGSTANSTGNFGNSGAIGNGASTTANNKLWLGNSLAEVWTQISFNVSDGRFKSNIQQNVPGLDFILAIEPVTYTFDAKKLDLFKAQGNPKLIEKINSDTTYSKLEIRTGFIAQDVYEVAKSIDFNFSGVSIPKNPTDVFGLDYSAFVVPLVKSVQEQQNLINILIDQNIKLETALNMLTNELEKLKEPETINNLSQSAPLLKQNSPNPFTNSTQIPYFIPNNVQNAKIIITDISGRIVKAFNIVNSGFGAIEISSNEFYNGVYLYSLYCGDLLIDTKFLEVNN